MFRRAEIPIWEIDVTVSDPLESGGRMSKPSDGHRTGQGIPGTPRWSLVRRAATGGESLERIECEAGFLRKLRHPILATAMTGPALHIRIISAPGKPGFQDPCAIPLRLPRADS
jgi:hypothetical protein